jgi:hypothetical protein
VVGRVASAGVRNVDRGLVIRILKRVTTFVHRLTPHLLSNPRRAPVASRFTETSYVRCRECVAAAARLSFCVTSFDRGGTTQNSYYQSAGPEEMFDD